MTTAFTGVGVEMAAIINLALVPFNEVISISGPSMTKDEVDATSLSTPIGYREFLAGFQDAGEITATMNWEKAEYDNMKVFFESNTSKAFRITMADLGDAVFNFNGIVIGIPINISGDAPTTYDLQIKLVGKPTLST